MPVWITLGICAAVFVLVIALAGSQGVFDGGMSEEEADVPPAQRLSDDAGSEEIAALTFTPALWGYRPAEVDDAILKLQARIAVQDAQLAALGAADQAPLPVHPQPTRVTETDNGEQDSRALPADL